MIKNMKIKAKLLFSYFVLCIVMVIIGGVGFYNISKLNQATDTMYEDPYKGAVSMGKISRNIELMRLCVQRIVLEDMRSDLEANIQEREKVKKEYTESINEYVASASAEEDKRNIETLLLPAVEKYEEYVTNVQTLAKEGKYEEALGRYKNATEREELLYAIDTMTAWNEQYILDVVHDAESTYKVAAIMIVIVIVVGVIIALVFGLVIAGMIVKPLQAVQLVAGMMAENDLTHHVDSKYVEQKDEIGDLAKSIEKMIQNLQNVVSSIMQESNLVQGQVDDVNHGLVELQEKVTDTSAASQELSAGMEETGASAEEMEATATEIGRDVEETADKAQEGAKMADEIHNRAVKLKTDITNSKNKANNIFEEIKGGLEAAIRDSKAVEEINTLADSILQITSQTNLLALNAAIEAARAGEAGKGFAVVADEIRDLAENSKNAVGRIQEITKLALNAVSNLSKNSNDLLRFVAEDVTKDYENMIVATDLYNSDAQYVSEMTEDFKVTADKLADTLQGMLRTISEVSTAAQEGAETTTTVAEKNTEIAGNTDKIYQTIQNTANSANNLLTLVNHFKV